MNQIKTILALSVILGFLTCQQTEKKDDTTAIVGLLALQSQSRSATPSPTLTYSGASSVTALVLNSAMTTLTPNTSNFTATSYSVSPALPTGITLNTTTGVISGTPSASVLTRTAYTITATSASSSVTFSLSLLVGASGAFSCGFQGTSGGCTNSIAYTCTNAPTCYSTLSACQAATSCLPN
ncbi:MAG: putative Ig domain-containing protein [Leptospiraceae bacterium]|nr:putative Ig domain-containing protein [Leptospiraceae bacterium]